MKDNLVFLVVNYEDKEKNIYISNEYVYNMDNRILAHISYNGKDHMLIPKEYILDALDKISEDVSPFSISEIEKFNSI